VNTDAVAAIAASMQEIGQMNAVRLRAKTIVRGGILHDQFELIAGQHRYEAALLLQWEDIEAEIVEEDDLHAELSMIDENLCRAELSPADRAVYTARRKAIFLQLHPETGHGKSSPNKDDKLSSFPEQTASATGRDKRTIQRDAERGEKISERALRMLSGTRLDTGVTLDRIKRLPTDMQETWVNAALADEKRIQAEAKDIRAAKQKLRHTVRLSHMTLVAEAGKPMAGPIKRKCSVIYADPPWKFGVHSEVTGREKSAENHYPTMDTAAISALFDELGDPATRDAVLFMWATNPMLPEALTVMAAWGFKYVHHWIWDKEVAGTGYWGRDRHELLLIGRRGEPATPLPGTQPETVYRERKGRHSAKPDWYAEQIERLYPGVPKLEMFCRAPRAGWDVWGFETGEVAA